MRQKSLKRKTVSLLLAAAMIITSFPALGMDARAAGTSDHSLSVTAFATKEQLMEAFTPDENGNSSTIGKLAFGKNSDGQVQEWYILGEDDGVTGDNTVLFAAGRIATNQKFYANTATKSYDDTWGCAYTGGAPAEVNANHYGGSDLRAKLKEIAGNTNCFTTAEQNLMNGTTVTTHDTKADADYTTTDKLYALTADGIGASYTTIKAGTNDQIVLAMSTYWSSGNDFLLRAPDTVYTASRVYVASANFGYVVNRNVDSYYVLVPAFDLNLSSVIFASAANAASSGNAETGTINDGTAMTLRLDGSGESIGSAVYDDAAGNITAQKDADATGTVSLVVQGNDGTKDWYYSVPAEGATVVTKEQIQNACGISEDISLADCKIWLETTIDNAAYAKMAAAATPVTITGSDQILTYDVSAIDVSEYFSIDTNAVTPTYSLVEESGVTTGTGSLSGKELTVTKIGVFRVKLTTAAQGIYAAGEKTITLTVTGKPLTDDMITVASGPHYYTGSAVTPAVTVTDGLKTLVSGTDYTVSYGNNTPAGTATITVTGKGNYTGTINKEFTITGKSLTDSMVTVASGPHYYTGNAVTPAVTVTDGLKTLISGTDYTVSYENNTDVGTATVTVTGMGNYTGTIEKTFDIILTDADQVAAAKKVVEDTLADYTATNSTTTQEIQDKIDEALTNAGISDMTVTVGDIAKTEATTSVEGSISGSVSITKGNESDSVAISKTIAQLPATDAGKVEAAKKVVQEALAGITATNEITRDEIQSVIDLALEKAGLAEDVTVILDDLARTEATTSEPGSISGNIAIVCGTADDSVPVNKTIAQLPKTPEEKVAEAKAAVEEALAGITVTNDTTKEDIQKVIDAALSDAGITDVTVTVGDLVKTDATTEEAGSIRGSIVIGSREDESVSVHVPITVIIDRLPQEKPDVSDKPEKPDVSDKPEKPDVSDKQEKPDVSDKQEKPDVSDKQEKPDVSDKQEKPDVSDKPDTPAVSGNQPGQTEQPSGSGSVSNAARPGNSRNDGNGSNGRQPQTVEQTVPEADSSGETDTGKPTPGGEMGQTIPVSLDQNKAVIKGEPAAAGTVQGMTGTSLGLKLGDGMVIVTVVCEEQEYTAGVADTVAVANAVLTPDQIQSVNDGETIEIRVDVKDISQNMPASDKEVIESGVEEYRKDMPELTLGMYVDISVFIRVGTGGWDAVTSTGEPVEVVIGIPEELREDGREFYIIRSHEGEYAFLEDIDGEPDTITISTDRFSAYAIAYRQTEETKGDRCGLCHICPTFLGICCFIWLAVFLAAVLVIVWISLRRMRKESRKIP